MSILVTLILFLICSMVFVFVFITDSRTKTLVIVGVLVPSVGIFILVVGWAELYPKEALDSQGFVVNVASGLASGCLGVPIAYFILQRLFREEQDQRSLRKRRSELLGSLAAAVDHAQHILVTRHGRDHVNTMRASRRLTGFIILLTRNDDWPVQYSRREFETLLLTVSGIMSGLSSGSSFHLPPGADPAWYELRRSWRASERGLDDWEPGSNPVPASVVEQVNDHLNNIDDDLIGLTNLSEQQAVINLSKWLRSRLDVSRKDPEVSILVEKGEVDFDAMQEAYELLKSTADKIMIKLFLVRSLQSVFAMVKSARS